MVHMDDQAGIEKLLKRKFYFYRNDENDTEVFRKNVVTYQDTPQVLNIMFNVLAVSNFTFHDCNVKYE